MRRILYLTFYFEPDLCAGSFRNTPLVKELASKMGENDEIEVLTTVPNRYITYRQDAPAFEESGNLKIYRFEVPSHKSGMKDQVNTFNAYARQVRKLTSGKSYDLVFASSSRLFTAWLGYKIAKRKKIPLYLDIRDIFYDTMKDVLKNPIVKTVALPALKQLEAYIFNYASHINLISGGFRSYFSGYKKPIYSNFSNGIDTEFLNLESSLPINGAVKKIVYAGNIGEGQGLHKIVPQAAKLLGNHYRFVIIGDGGAKRTLLEKIDNEQVNNVEIMAPVARKELINIYADADFLFIHLNDYDAFKKVLPSKVFELGAYDKPIIAGVAGYANRFIAENLTNTILFLPGDVDDMVSQLRAYQYKNEMRHGFIEKFKRDNINREMAKSILSYL